MLQTLPIANKYTLQHTWYNSVRAPLITSKGEWMTKSNKNVYLLSTAKKFLEEGIPVSNWPQLQTSGACMSCVDILVSPLQAHKQMGISCYNSCLKFSKWYFYFVCIMICNECLFLSCATCWVCGANSIGAARFEPHMERTKSDVSTGINPSDLSKSHLNPVSRYSLQC